jgi:hypothetical protein
MTWVKLRGKFGSSGSDSALTTLGKIIVALSAIGGVLGGLIDIVQGYSVVLTASTNRIFEGDHRACCPPFIYITHITAINIQALLISLLAQISIKAL